MMLPNERRIVLILTGVLFLIVAIAFVVDVLPRMVAR